MKTRILVLSLALLGFLVRSAPTQEPNPNSDRVVDRESIAKQSQSASAFRKVVAEHIVELCGVMMREHVDPPAKQQLILAAVNAAWSARETNESHADGGELRQPKIRRLGRDVSELRSDDEFTNYLVQCFDEIGVTKETHANLADRMVESLLFAAPGGGQVTKA